MEEEKEAKIFLVLLFFFFSSVFSRLFSSLCSLNPPWRISSPAFARFAVKFFCPLG